MARINSKFYINQNDYSDIVMWTDTSVTPNEVYTIKRSGCGVSCLAMFLLSKSGLSTVTDKNKKDALNAIINGGFITGASMYKPPQSKTISFNGNSIKVGFKKTTDVAAGVQNGGIGFVRIYRASPYKSHFVFVDGLNNASQAAPDDPDNLKKHLVVDPGYGTSMTLHEAIKKALGSTVTPRATDLDADWKCLFD
jgi:hypothetical protein